MTVGIENTAHNDNTTASGTSSVTISTFTVTTANALCVGISFLTLGGTPPTSVSATWNASQSMTQVAHATASGLDAYIFALLAPAAGANNLVVSWTNNANWGIGVMGLTGVSQVSLAAAFNNATTNTGTGTTASVAVSTSGNGGVFGIAVDNDPTSTASGANHSVLFLGNGIPSTSAGDFVSNYAIPSQATPITLSYTLGTGSWAYAGININGIVPLNWGFEQYNQYQSPYSTVRNTHRAGAVKGKSGYAIFPIPFKEGWQVQPPQPPFQPSINKRSGAFSHPEDGIEGNLIRFFPSGWEIQPPQPPANPQIKQKGSILRGSDGIEGKYINTLSFIDGWEIQPPQLSVNPNSKQKAIGALSHPEEEIEIQYITVLYGWEIQPFQPPTYPTIKQRYSGIEDKATAPVFTLWTNGGWEIQSVQPPVYPTTHQKIGSLSQWEDGIEGIYVFNAPASQTQTYYDYDIQQPPLKINYRSGSWSQKTDGIEYPFTRFFPSGWEIQFPPPPHTFTEKRGAILRGDDGIQYRLINRFPTGWEIQSYQPPFYPKTNQKLAALSHPEEGIEGIYVFNAPKQPIWGFDIQSFYSTTAPPRNQRYLATKGKAEFAIFPYWINSGWEIQSVQPPAYPTTTRKAIGALSHPEEGIEAYLIHPAKLEWGFELQSGWQPPFYPTINQRIGALSHPEEGIEGIYVFNAPKQPIWGFDITSFQSISIPTNIQKYSGVRQRPGFAVFPSWVNNGWEVQWLQPPAYPKTNQKSGALSHPEEGIEAVYVFNAPKQPIWGFDIQPSTLFPRYYPNAKVTPNSGDDGTEALYINFLPYIWDLQPPQPPVYPKTNQKTGALSHPEEGIEAVYVFNAPKQPIWSWDIQPTISKINYRSGAWSQKTEGIEYPFINFLPYGWEVQPPQPPHQFVERKGSTLRGIDGIETQYMSFSYGWEIQSPQSPAYLTKINRYYGIIGRNQFAASNQLPPPIINWGWDVQSQLRPPYKYLGGLGGKSEFSSFSFYPYGWEIPPPHLRSFLTIGRRVGALSHPEEGIEGIFIFNAPNQPIWSWDIQPTISKINYRSGSWSQWEDGIEYPFINFLPYGWEVQPPQPPTFPKANQKIGALSHPEEGIEGIYVFNAPKQPIWGFDIQQPPLKIYYRSGSWSQKTDGIESPYIKFLPYIWDLQSPQPPTYPKTNQKSGALSHPEEGIEAVYVFNAPKQPIWGFDIQSITSKVYYRSGSWSQKTDGIEYPFTKFFPGGWEIQSPQSPAYLTKINRYYGIIGRNQFAGSSIATPAKLEWGFELQTPWQPLLYPTTKQKYAGIKSKLTLPVYSTWVNVGWEIQPVQPPVYPATHQKWGALSNQDRLDAKFVFVAPLQPKWGWEFQPYVKLPYKHIGALKGSSQFASFSFLPYGWEIQPFQPPAYLTRTNKYFGIEGRNQFASFSTTPVLININWGYDFQQPPPKINYRSGAWSQKTEGIEYPLIRFFPVGWEIQPPQPPHPKPEVKAAAILRGDDGIQNILIRFFRSGWEIQPPQPPFFLRTNQKIAALSHPEEGTEGIYVFHAPPFFTEAWEVQSFQPPHIFTEKKGSILRGDEGTEYKFINFHPYGWYIQPPQPPFSPKTNQKIAGALSKWEDGIEAKYVFVAPPPILWAWEALPAQLRHWLTIRQQWGALSQWEDGIEAVYVFVPPPIPPPPPPSVVLGPASGLHREDMQVLGISPSSILYWDYGNTEAFYVWQNSTLYRISAQSAFTWYGVTPNATTIYNPFLSDILSGKTIKFSTDDQN